MKLVWKESTVSTNEDAKQLAAFSSLSEFRKVSGSEQQPTIIGTDYQTAGRGRKGSNWSSSPKENLMASLLFYPEMDRVQWGWIALLSGAVVCRYLSELGIKARLKWPNDVLVNDRKICGILSEAGENWCVVGVGLNLNMQEVPKTEGLEATSVFLESGYRLNPKEVATELFSELVKVVQTQKVDHFSALVESSLAWKGEKVSLSTGKETIFGIIEGVGALGQLLLNENGQSREIYDAQQIRPLRS